MKYMIHMYKPVNISKHEDQKSSSPAVCVQLQSVVNKIFDLLLGKLIRLDMHLYVWIMYCLDIKKYIRKS